jgi:hypothetical protein
VKEKCIHLLLGCYGGRSFVLPFLAIVSSILLNDLLRHDLLKLVSIEVVF